MNGGRRYIMLLAFAASAGVAAGGQGAGSARWVASSERVIRLAPRAMEYAALESARDCRLLRGVAERARGEMAKNRGYLDRVKALLNDRREELEECARANGITRVDTEDEDRRLAEVCLAQYEAWLKPGYRLAMLRQDLRETSESLEQLRSVLSYRCGDGATSESAALPTERKPTAPGIKKGTGAEAALLDADGVAVESGVGSLPGEMERPGLTAGKEPQPARGEIEAEVPSSDAPRD